MTTEERLALELAARKPTRSPATAHSTIGARAKVSTYRRQPPITLPKISILEDAP